MLHIVCLGAPIWPYFVLEGTSSATLCPPPCSERPVYVDSSDLTLINPGGLLQLEIRCDDRSSLAKTSFHVVVEVEEVRM